MDVCHIMHIWYVITKIKFMKYYKIWKVISNNETVLDNILTIDILCNQRSAYGEHLIKYVEEHHLTCVTENSWWCELTVYVLTMWNNGFDAFHTQRNTRHWCYSSDLLIERIRQGVHHQGLRTNSYYSLNH